MSRGGWPAVSRACTCRRAYGTDLVATFPGAGANLVRAGGWVKDRAGWPSPRSRRP